MVTHPRIVLIHAVQVAMGPIARAFATDWPEAELVNVLEDSLSPDRARDKDLSEAMTRRIGDLGDYAAGIGADGILYTCSAFGAAIERVAFRLPLPVLKPNDAMFDAAFERGTRIGMLATFRSSVAGMEAEFAEAARVAGLDVRVETVLVDHALDALKSGDADTNNGLLAEATPKLSHCDAIMLAHFSTSRARKAVEERTIVPILTSPDCAVKKLRARIVG